MPSHPDNMAGFVHSCTWELYSLKASWGRGGGWNCVFLHTFAWDYMCCKCNLMFTIKNGGGSLVLCACVGADDPVVDVLCYISAQNLVVSSNDSKLILKTKHVSWTVYGFELY